MTQQRVTDLSFNRWLIAIEHIYCAVVPLDLISIINTDRHHGHQKRYHQCELELGYLDELARLKNDLKMMNVECCFHSYINAQLVNGHGRLGRLSPYLISALLDRV